MQNTERQIDLMAKMEFWNQDFRLEGFNTQGIIGLRMLRIGVLMKYSAL